jgi:large subunit ribosomal protein L22
MSAEEEKENETPGDAPVEPAAEKPAEKKPAAKKAADKPSANAADKPSAKAEKKPAAKAEEVEEPSAEAEEPPAAQPEEPSAEAGEPTAETEPATKKPAKARRTKKAAPAVDEQPAGEPVAEAPAEEVPAEEVPAKAAAPEPQPAVAGKRKPAERRQVVRARARYVRTSARKARMVCGHIRGKSVPEARAILAFTPRDVARDWSKLLESAVANAENNHELLEDDLVVREAYADEGPTIKRFRPRAMGRATPIRKRTSHLTITLTPRS